MSYFHTPWKTSENLFFWRFQGVKKWDIGVKRVKSGLETSGMEIG